VTTNERDRKKQGALIGSGEMYVGDCLEVMRGFPDRHVSMTITSPPYEGQRTYGIDFKLTGQKWVDWMLPRVVEMCRVTDGLVFINAAGPVRDFQYSPSMEWLVADLTRSHGIVCGPSPYAWLKMEDRDDASGNGIPGSGGRCYQRRDWEPIYAFALPDRLPVKWSDNLAYGTAPKGTSFGGEFSNRHADGQRRNAKTGAQLTDGRTDPWRKNGRGAGCGPRQSNGERRDVKRFRNAPDGTVKGGHARDICAIANAGNILRIPVGGGKLGHSVGHVGEAPFPLGLPARFIAWFVPPDGTVLDPFMGSGTTAHAAEDAARKWIGIDIRASQAELVSRRLGTVTKALFA
jgi:hypothetical protein